MVSLRDFISICENFVLVEDRMETVRAMMVPKITAKVRSGKVDSRESPPHDRTRMLSAFADGGGLTAPGGPERIANDIFDLFIETDPDPKKIYVQWICRMWLSGNVILEDLYRVQRDLSLYSAVKAKLPAELRDINRFKTPSDLSEAIKSFRLLGGRAVDRALDAEMRQQAEIIYVSAGWEIVIPKTMEAACYFGRDTDWCTATKDPQHNRFKDYNGLGRLFVILDKQSGERWQLHLETAQFMDIDDHPVNLMEFVKQHKEPAEAIFGTYLGEAPIYSASAFDGRSKNINLTFFAQGGFSQGSQEPGLTLIRGWKLEGERDDYSTSRNSFRPIVGFYLDSRKNFVKFEDKGDSMTKDWTGHDDIKFLHILNMVGAKGTTQSLANKSIIYDARANAYKTFEAVSKPYMTVAIKEDGGDVDTHWRVAHDGDATVYVLSAEVHVRKRTTPRAPNHEFVKQMADLLVMTVKDGYLTGRWTSEGQQYAEYLGQPVYELLMKLDPNLKAQGYYYPWGQHVNGRVTSVIADIFPADAGTNEGMSKDWRAKLVKARPQWGNEKDRTLATNHSKTDLPF